MLSAIAVTQPSVADSGRPVVARENARTSPPSASSAIEVVPASPLAKRLPLLVLPTEQRVTDSLAALADQLGEQVGLSREENESDGDFVRRLVTTIAKLAPEERSALQGKLTQLVKVLQQDTLLYALRDAAGPDGPRLSADPETVWSADQDPGARRVTSSYAQNSDAVRLSAEPAPLPGPRGTPLPDSGPQARVEIRQEPAKISTTAGTPIEQRTEGVRGTSAVQFPASLGPTIAQVELSHPAKGHEALLSNASRSEPASAIAPKLRVAPTPTRIDGMDVSAGKEPPSEGESAGIGDIVRGHAVRPEDVGTRNTGPGSRTASVDADRALPVTRDRPTSRFHVEEGQGVVPPGLNAGFPAWPENPESDADPTAALIRLLKHVLAHEEETTTGSAEMSSRTTIASGVRDRKAGASTPAAPFSHEAAGDEAREVRSQPAPMGDTPVLPSGSTEGRLPAATALRDNPAFPFFGYLLFEDDVTPTEQARKRSQGEEHGGGDDGPRENGSEGRPGSGQTSGEEEEGEGEDDVHKNVDAAAIAEPISAFGGETVLTHYLTMSTLA